jgi:hypothetical protein
MRVSSTATMAYINVHAPVGINEIKAINSSCSVYPNPANGDLNINFSSKSPILNYQLLITDILGNDIYKQTINSIDSRIDVSKWNNGVYFYQIRGDKETLQGKFVKQ